MKLVVGADKVNIYWSYASKTGNIIKESNNITALQTSNKTKSLATTIKYTYQQGRTMTFAREIQFLNSSTLRYNKVSV